MSQGDDRASLLDVLKAARLATGFVAGMDQATFNQDLKTQAAVAYQLMVVGEAVKRISEPFRAAHPEIEWRQVAGMRDVLIHDYDDVDLLIVWECVTVEIPALIRQIEPLIR